MVSSTEERLVVPAQNPEHQFLKKAKEKDETNRANQKCVSESIHYEGVLELEVGGQD
jgi:hypothetical protein